MIPKVIHYCWFGPHELPTSVLKCTDSWKLHLPEYKIKKWTIDNTAKFHKHTNWQPEIPFEKTMLDLLNYWRDKIKNGNQFLIR